MGRLIDADRALEIVRDQGIAHPNAYHLTNYATLILREAPTVDVAPVRHGRWDNIPNTYMCVSGKDGSYHGCATSCSVCHEINPNAYKTNYCPNCGAKMDGGHDG